MHLFVWFFVVVAFVGFNLYVTDTVHRMKEDMRTVKIRTGKIIHLLDAVLGNFSGSGILPSSSSREMSEEAGQETTTKAFIVNNENGYRESSNKNNSSGASILKSIGSFVLPTGGVQEDDDDPSIDQAAKNADGDGGDEDMDRILARIRGSIAPLKRAT